MVTTQFLFALGNFIESCEPKIIFLVFGIFFNTNTSKVALLPESVYFLIQRIMFGFSLAGCFLIRLALAS